jgi:multicomponent Na+:H+ antiporter subunit F
MVEIVLGMAFVLIFLAMVFGVIRLVIGPDTVDRVVAIDLLTIISIAVIALLAHIANRYIYLDVALVYGLLSFLGVLAVARYLEKGF